MFLDDPKFTATDSATFREFVLLPRQTRPEHALSEVSLRTRWVAGQELAIPFLSAAMESVSGAELAIALALQGGLSVLPAGRVELEDQLAQVEAVKRFQAGRVEACSTVSADWTLSRLNDHEARTGFSSFPVVDGEGRLLGLISSTMYHPVADGFLTVAQRMVPKEALRLIECEVPASQVGERMLQDGVSKLCEVDSEGRLQGMHFFQGWKEGLRYPQATRDARQRLQVGAALSTHPEDQERGRQCVEAGADLLVVDASDGYSDFMAQTLERAKSLGVPVVAGNVVDEDGFRFLAEAGADAIKVGIGSGSICTTRRVKAIGRGQATAVRAVARARDDWAQRTGRYLPLISDGGLEGTGDMAVALALGADLLMMGKYFAGFDESPTQPYRKRFPVMLSGQVGEVEAVVKPYWGEASARAKNVRRYQQDDPRTFVIEGEEGYVLSKGSLHHALPRDLKALQGTLSSCGCRNLEEFHRHVRLERQSLGSQHEGGTSIFRS